MVAESVRSGNKTATLGPTIHNRHVVDKFLKLGVREIAAPEEAEPGETVIIRAHGVPKRVQEKLAGSGANVLDATCPFVKKIHTIVKNETEKGRKILIFGSPTHPEVADRLYEYDELLEYFVYRHFMKALGDDVLIEKVQFALICTCFIQLLGIYRWLTDGRLTHWEQICLCKACSREIEYNEDNVEAVSRFLTMD